MPPCDEIQRDDPSGAATRPSSVAPKTHVTRGRPGGVASATRPQARPSSGIRAPFTAAAAGDARNASVSAISSGVVQAAFFGVGAVSRSCLEVDLADDHELAVTPSPATSRASERSRSSSAAFAMA